MHRHVSIRGDIVQVPGDGALQFGTGLVQRAQPRLQRHLVVLLVALTHLLFLTLFEPYDLKKKTISNLHPKYSTTWILFCAALVVALISPLEALMSAM